MHCPSLRSGGARRPGAGMSEDVWTALVKGVLGFAHSRAGDMVGTTFKDTGSFLKSLFDGASGTTKGAIDRIKADVNDLKPIGKALADALKPKFEAAKTAVTNMANEIQTDPFTLEAAARAATELAYVLIAFDEALDILAEKIAEREENPASKQQVLDAISGITDPWKAPFKSLGADAVKAFDTLCKAVLGVDDAHADVANALVWSRPDKKLGLKFLNTGPRSIGALGFDGAYLEAFLDYKTQAKVGIELHTRLAAGLRSDKLLEKIMPGQGKTAETDQVAITLDTADGLTFGAGKDKKLILPVRFAFPGVELREFAMIQPAKDNKDSQNRIDVVMTIAGKLGDAFAIVVEGGGISIRWVDGTGPDVQPKIPTGMGVRIRTGVVNGGGYLRYAEDSKEYGGVFDLQFAKLGITAIGLLGTDPVSFVIVIGVHFAPKIDLGFGFTLNGLGGILAIERAIDTVALSDGLKTDIVGQLLFPSDPIAAAPQILDQLGKVFPHRDGGFVVGPIAEIGWGSQAGFVKARLGVALSLPDPKVVILGAIEIGVPSADIKPDKRIVDIHADLLGEITPDYFLLKVSIAKSKLFTLTLSGDIALFIKWAGEGAFALSVGGFFPKYDAPKEIGKLDRLSVAFKPPVDWLKITAEAYVAITSNSIQFGGKLDLSADVGVASAHAWIQLDSLFQWAPYFHFIVILDVGIEVKAFGATIAGVHFHGELSGDQPWRLEGTATAEILWWDVDVDIGPLTWGEPRPADAPLIDSVHTAAEALRADAAWTPILPPDALQLVRFADTGGERLFHPLGRLEVKQARVPLETQIDRIGSSPVSAKHVYLGPPKVGGDEAAAVSTVQDRFSPGHFLALKDDDLMARPDFEQMPAGMVVAASAKPVFTSDVNAAYAWNTVYPNRPEPALTVPLGWKIAGMSKAMLGASAVAKARRINANPYLVAPPAPPEPVLADPGLVTVVHRDTLAPLAAASTDIGPTRAAEFMAGSNDLGVLASGLAA
jgi:hypothetical protein